jgi:hypothetical protein
MNLKGDFMGLLVISYYSVTSWLQMVIDVFLWEPRWT